MKRQASVLMAWFLEPCVVKPPAVQGAEAVTAARQNKPDVVLMDLRMPGLDGVQATSAILQARRDEGAEHGKLNARDLRILQHIGEGLSNKEIAEKLSLTASTVRIYVSNILARLGVSNRAEAVSLGIARGLMRRSESK